MNLSLSSTLNQINTQRMLVFGLIIVLALVSFEIFNYSTTVFALTDLLGDLRFAGIRWATILSIAFCGIDFAGIARLFTPNQKSESSSESWYLLGAWILAASMNATLTWWGVSLALLNHETLGNSVIDHATLMQIVPLFVAVMVMVIRVLIIGTFSSAGNHLFGSNSGRTNSVPNLMGQPRRADTQQTPAPARVNAPVSAMRSPSMRPRTNGFPSTMDNRPEPVYNSASMNMHASSNGNGSFQNM